MKVVFGFGLKSCFVKGTVQKDKNLEAANKDLGWWEPSLEQKALKCSVELSLGPSLGSCPQIPLGLPPLERQRSPDELTHSLPKNQRGKPERVVSSTDNFSQDLCRSCCPTDPRYAQHMQSPTVTSPACRTGRFRLVPATAHSASTKPGSVLHQLLV